MSAALINTKVGEAVDAIESGDFATAITKLLAAKALLSARTDTRHGSSELRWDRKAIDSLITQCRQEQAAAAVSNNGALQRTKVNYVNPGASDEEC